MYVHQITFFEGQDHLKSFFPKDLLINIDIFKHIIINNVNNKIGAIN